MNDKELRLEAGISPNAGKMSIKPVEVNFSKQNNWLASCSICGAPCSNPDSWYQSKGEAPLCPNCL